VPLLEILEDKASSQGVNTCDLHKPDNQLKQSRKTAAKVEKIVHEPDHEQGRGKLQQGIGHEQNVSLIKVAVRVWLTFPQDRLAAAQHARKCAAAGFTFAFGWRFVNGHGALPRLWRI